MIKHQTPFTIAVVDGDFLSFVSISVAYLWQQKLKSLQPQWLKAVCMETAGFEPASKDPDTNLSTCVVY